MNEPHRQHRSPYREQRPEFRPLEERSDSEPAPKVPSAMPNHSESEASASGATGPGNTAAKPVSGTTPDARSTNRGIRELYRRWCAEDRELEHYLDGLRNWIHGQTSPTNPQPEKLRCRLRELRTRLEIHFRREDQIAVELSHTFETPPVELDATYRQASHDHRQLLDRLDRFIARTEAQPLHDANWQEAIEELELFVDVLEQHEDQESESIELLMPHDPRGR